MYIEKRKKLFKNKFEIQLIKTMDRVSTIIK